MRRLLGVSRPPSAARSNFSTELLSWPPDAVCNSNDILTTAVTRTQAAFVAAGS